MKGNQTLLLQVDCRGLRAHGHGGPLPEGRAASEQLLQPATLQRLEVASRSH